MIGHLPSTPAKVNIDVAITEPEKITETLPRLGIESTGPPKTVGFIFEAGGEWQLQRFKKNPTKKIKNAAR